MKRMIVDKGKRSDNDYIPIPGSAMTTRENITCPIAFFAVICIIIYSRHLVVHTTLMAWVYIHVIY